MSERVWRVKGVLQQYPHGAIIAEESIAASNPGLAVNRAFGYMREDKFAKKQIHELTFYVSSIPNKNSEAGKAAKR
jgi:hypothetical protein